MAKTKGAAAAASKAAEAAQDAAKSDEGGKSNEVQLTAAQIEALSKLPTASAKMRYLDSEGYTRSQIAKALNKRYQHVRNVLITPLASQGGNTEAGKQTQSQ